MYAAAPVQEEDTSSKLVDLNYKYQNSKIIKKINVGERIIRNIYWNSYGDEILTLCSDDKVELYQFNESDENTDNILTSTNCIKMKQHIYDIEWVPNGNDNKYFVAVGADIPVQLWDLKKNSIKQNYHCPNHVGVYKTGVSCCVPYSGNIIIAGFKKRIHVFDIEQPNNTYRVETVNKAKQGQKSIISCMEFFPDNDKLFIAGSYDGYTQIYDLRHFYR
eukprot:UN23117